MKSLNYLNNIMAKIEANLANADEGLMLNEEGYVAECTGDNVFIVKRGVIYTPPIYAGSLRGITWQAVLDIAAELGLKVDSPAAHPLRHLHGGRVFPHRHRGGSHRGGEPGQPGDRRRQAGPDHPAHHRPIPRVDAKHGNADLFLVLHP